MLHCDGQEYFDSENCKAWIQDKMMIMMISHDAETKDRAIPMTSSPYALFHFAKWFMPSLQTMAVNYAMKTIIDQVNPVKFIPAIVDSIVPSKYFWNTQEKKRMDEAIETYASQTNPLQRITESKMNLMVLVISILLLYFQYTGMTTMKDKQKQYTSLLDKINGNEDDLIPNSNKAKNFLKHNIFGAYKKSRYYKDDDDDDDDNEDTIIDQWLSPKEYSIVRVIFNTLVGLNSTLFLCLGGQSDDPTHEIVHWAKVLMYSQILTMLLRKHGLGPMTLATKLVLRKLWTMKKKKVGKENHSSQQAIQPEKIRG